MKAIDYLILSAILVSLAGCVTPWPQPRPTTCPKHHVALQSRIMFRPGPRTSVDPSIEYLEVMTRVGDRFPYCIPFGFSEGRNDIFEVRTRVYYCPHCEEGTQRAFSNLATNSEPTDSRVLRIAATVARDNGFQLSEYGSPHVRYDSSDRKWWVPYDRKASQYRGDHFAVSIDDRTRKTQLFRGR